MRVIGIDVGGTFTDFVLYDSGHSEPRVLKISSSANPTDTMTSGIIQLCAAGAIEPNQIDRVIHGTTVATNAIIERKGARTAMVLLPLSRRHSHRPSSASTELFNSAGYSLAGNSARRAIPAV
jgi:N-methylhydantoinase A/oxoprolinase/acetone carboxylase beta subunit